MISIASLIYRSPRYADAVHDSLRRHTPMLADGRAEFFFVANDATPAVLQHLRDWHYPHVVNVNPRRSERELFAMGIGWPEYIHRVYRGWNHAIRCAAGEVVVLVNSDNAFSPNWLENLIKHLTPQTVVCAQLVERSHPKHGVFPGAWHGEFGNSPDRFDEVGFLAFAQAVSRPETRPGGAYMPCALRKEAALRAGLYPEGNLAGPTVGSIGAYGDEVFFRRLAELGVRHITAMDSISYHYKEGEMDEAGV